MAADLEKLVVRIEANLTQFEKAMAKANGVTTRELRKMETQATASAGRIERAMAGIGAKFNAFAAGAIAGLGIQQIATAAQTAIKSIADIADAAQRLGLTTNEYQDMAFAAQLAGVETDKLAVGLKKLAVNSSEAARGNGTLGEILKLNNVSIRDANGNLLSQVEILKTVAELVRNAASEQDQAAIAQAAFGKSGIDLLTFLQDGAAGVARAMESANNDIKKFTAEQIAAAGKFDDQIDILIQNITVGLKGAFVDLAPDVQRFVDTSVQEFEFLSAKAQELGAMIASIFGSAPAAAAGKGDLASGLTSSGLKVSTTDGASLAGSVDAYIKKAIKPTVLPTKPMAAARSFVPRARADKPRNIVADAIKERDAVAELIAQLRFEGEQLRRNDLQQEIHNELRRAGVSATSEQGKQIAALVTANHSYAQSQDLVKEAEQSRLDSVNELRDAQMQLASTAVDALDAIIIQGQDADEVLKNLVKTLASQSLQGLFLGQGPLGSLFGQSKGGGIFGALFGGLAGARAAGGPVSAGKSYLVGERGPEIFRPSGSGSIMPNGKIGGSSLVFAPVINAQNADKAAIASLQNQLQQMKRDFSKMVVGSVNKERGLNVGFA